MKIALIGYGKMGKAIESIALSRQHKISYRISQSNLLQIKDINPANTDVAIEFTQPEAALGNIVACLQNKVPVISGTTGWLAEQKEAEQICLAQQTAFLHASNFSVGVNLFFKVNSFLAKLMANHSQYAIDIEEIHHTQKKDAPSGTALVIAEQIMANIPQKNAWVLANDSQQIENNLLPIKALRLPEVPGTHTISYTSAQDSIMLTHQAHNRTGFAFGAVVAAEWIAGKQGIFTMADVLEL
jgi:4-hydroxy-tetrahydrodipicolinate reductase